VIKTTCRVKTESIAGSSRRVFFEEEERNLMLGVKESRGKVDKEGINAIKDFFRKV